MSNRRCTIGAVEHDSVEVDIVRQASASDLTRAWAGTATELRERTEEVRMAAKFGEELLDKTGKLETQVERLESEKQSLKQEISVLKKKLQCLSRKNDTILAESQRSVDSLQESLERVTSQHRGEELQRKRVRLRLMDFGLPVPTFGADFALFYYLSFVALCCT